MPWVSPRLVKPAWNFFTAENSHQRNNLTAKNAKHTKKTIRAGIAFCESLFVFSHMEYQRSERVGDLIMEVLAELLRKEIRDPRVKSVTLTAVKVSKDLRHARVYFNLLGGRSEERIEVLAGLMSATGFIRSRVAKQLQMRYAPSIEFTYDDTEDEAQRINELLKQVKS